MKSLIDASIIFITAALMLAYSAWGQSYTVTDLGNFMPSAITNDGVIVGSVPGPDGNRQGAWWQDGQLHLLPVRTDITDAHQALVVGSRSLLFPNGACCLTQQAYRATYDGQLIDLATPGFAVGSYANTVSRLTNGLDMVGGYIDQGLATFPVRWFTHENFAEVLFSPPGGGAVNASNVVGQLAGFIKQGTIDEVARWSFEGNLTSLGTLGGTFAFANDMNTAGVMVGWGNLATGQTMPFRSTGNSLTVLPLPTGVIGGQAIAINTGNEVVGQAMVAGQPTMLSFHALHWDANGFPVNLNSVSALPAGWQLLTAVGLTDDGRIAAQAWTGTERHGVLLTPGASAPLALGLSINQATFQPGQTLDTALTLMNPGPQRAVDMYVGIIFPDGWVWWVQDVNTFAGSASESLEDDPRTFTPLWANMTLIAGLNTTWEDFIEHTWTGIEGLGTYHLLVGWTVAGSLQDGRIDEGDLVALDWKAFTVSGASMASR